MRPYIEKQPSEFLPITAEKLIQSVKNTFRGDPPVPSSKREEMLNLAAFSAAHTSLEKLLPLGEPVVKSQIAVVFFPEMAELGKQFDAQVQQDGLTPTEVAQLVDAVRTEQHFQIPEKWGRLASIIFAMFLLLTTVTTACAADNSASPEAAQLTGQPTFIVDTPQPTPNAPQEGETPIPAEVAPRQICVFDSARNLRTGPSATANKTTLDGIGTTVAGKEYEYFEKVTNADKTVWVRLSKDGQQPQIWAVLVHPGLKLTGTTAEVAGADAKNPVIDAQTPISETVPLIAGQGITTTTEITTTITTDSPKPSAAATPQIEQGVVLSPREYTRTLFPANFEEYFAQKGKDVVFDEKYNIFFSVDRKTQKRLALFPHAAANDPEQDLAMAESFFDPSQSCLLDAQAGPHNPDGKTRQVCMFVNTQHPVIDGHIYFHPDLLKKQKELLKYIANYIYDGDEDRMNSEDFVLYINLAAEEDDSYQPRDFEDMDPANTASKYVQWGLNGIVRPGEPLYRLEKIATGPGKPDIIIMTAFQELSDLPSVVSAQQLPLLQWIVPYKPFEIGLMYSRSIATHRTSVGTPDQDIKVLGQSITALKTDRNATLGGSKAKPNYLATLAAMGQ